MQRTNMEKDLNKYYKEIRKALSIEGREKKKFVCELKSSIDEFLVRNPETSYPEILEQFGTPEAIVLSFMEQEDREQTVKRVYEKSWLYGFVVVAIYAVVVLIAVTCAFVIFDTYNINRG